MNKGLFHTSLVYLLFASGFISVSVNAQTNAQTMVFSHNSHTPYAGSITTPKRIVPQKTMGGAYSSNRLKSSSRKKFTQRNISKVRLKSKFPRKLGISNYEVLWRIKDLKRKNVRRHRGKVTTLQLAPGRYQVTLQIGKYKQKKTITVRKSRNSIQTFSMPIKAGLLKVTTGSSKGALGNTKIYVRNSRGRVVASSRGRSIKQLLRSGKYTVEVRYGNKSRGRNVVHIRNGAVKVTKVKLPVSGKIRLRAYEKGKQPLMKSSSWVIYNSAGKVVYRTKKHTIRKSLFPGSYTAKLTVAGKTKTKKFKVSSGQNKTITLYL